MRKVKIECTENQARVIKKALDLNHELSNCNVEFLHKFYKYKNINKDMKYKSTKLLKNLKILWNINMNYKNEILEVWKDSIKKNKKGFVIFCTESQAQEIQYSLDLYTRLQCGQMRELGDFLFSDGDYLLKEWIIYEIKNIFFPDLHNNESYGIFSDSAPETSKIGWDIIQCIRYELRDKEKNSYTVDQYLAMRSSKTEELIKVEVLEDDDA